MVKNLILGPNLPPPPYHRIQFQGRLLIQTQENDKKPHFGPDLGPLGPNSDGQIYFSKIWLQSLDIMFRYHHVQYQKKTNDPILRKFSDGRIDRRTNRWRRIIS